MIAASVSMRTLLVVSLGRRDSGVAPITKNRIFIKINMGFANLYLVQLSVTPTVSTPVLPIPVLVSISFPYYFCLPEHAKQ